MQEILQFGGWTNDQTDVPMQESHQKIGRGGEMVLGNMLEKINDDENEEEDEGQN
ncbi:MAG: hypothetical protein VX821_07205 [Verrucomicrobiota bacterium]|nr:hypothetical protein [Verrucomicrobiota bacterium]